MSHAFCLPPFVLLSISCTYSQVWNFVRSGRSVFFFFFLSTLLSNVPQLYTVVPFLWRRPWNVKLSPHLHDSKLRWTSCFGHQGVLLISVRFSALLVRALAFVASFSLLFWITSKIKVPYYHVCLLRKHPVFIEHTWSKKCKQHTI